MEGETEGERGALWCFSASLIHCGTGTGAIFHKIKAPLFRGTCCFTATVYRERRGAAVRGRKRPGVPWSTGLGWALCARSQRRPVVYSRTETFGELVDDNTTGCAVSRLRESAPEQTSTKLNEGEKWNFEVPLRFFAAIQVWKRREKKTPKLLGFPNNSSKKQEALLEKPPVTLRLSHFLFPW